MKVSGVLISAVLMAGLMGCESDLDTPNLDSIEQSNFINTFSLDPDNTVIPYPNNLLFNGTADGTINIPTTGLTGGELATVTALNSMDGFSMVAPMSTTFNSAIDASSLVAGTSVRIFEVTLGGSGEVNGFVAEVPGTEFAVTTSSVDGSDPNNPDPGANKLVITPLKPLKAGTAYAVVVTNAVKGSDGSAALPDLHYTFMKSDVALITGATQADALPGLLLGFDADESGLPLDATEEATAVASITALEGVRQLTQATEGVLSAFADPALAKPDIVVSWVFTTQSNAISNANHPLNQARGLVATDPVNNVSATSIDTTTAGYADIHVGTINVPYYLDPANPLGGFWESAPDVHLSPVAPIPLQNSSQVVPLLMTVPNATAPACVAAGDVATCKGSGWPVVIVQHGITQNRTSLLAIADALAARGFAAVAIDMPLHGIPADNDPLMIRAATLLADATAVERTFDLDLIDNETSAPGPDMEEDDSGTHYINLASLMTTRDNVYQSIADLFTVTQSLANSGAGTGLDYTGEGDGDFDPTRIYFVGHSLGGIVGATFLAIETNVKDAVLGMPGGGIAKLLDGSAGFGPVIAAGLGANGVNKGTAEYESFLASAQMLIDAGDPINYTTTLAARTDGLLVFEVVGDGATNLSDLVVPNTVPDANDTSNTIPAPLSGSTPLITYTGLQQLDADTAGPDLHAVVKFTAGHHGSLLSPDDANDVADATSAEVFYEMQHQAAQFLAGDGALDIDAGTPFVTDVTAIIQAAPVE